VNFLKFAFNEGSIPANMTLFGADWGVFDSSLNGSYDLDKNSQSCRTERAAFGQILTFYDKIQNSVLYPLITTKIATFFKRSPNIATIPKLDMLEPTHVVFNIYEDGV
jgi:hypothetical protein